MSASPELKRMDEDKKKSFSMFETLKLQDAEFHVLQCPMPLIRADAFELPLLSNLIYNYDPAFFEPFAFVMALTRTNGSPGVVLNTFSVDKSLECVVKMKLLPAALPPVSAEDTKLTIGRWHVVTACYGEMLVLEALSAFFSHMQYPPVMCKARDPFALTINAFNRNGSPPHNRGFAAVIAELDKQRRQFLQHHPDMKAVYDSPDSHLQPGDGRTFGESLSLCMVLPKIPITLEQLFRTHTLSSVTSPGALLSSVVLTAAFTLHLTQYDLDFCHCDLHVGNIFIRFIDCGTSSSSAYATLVPWLFGCEYRVLLSRSSSVWCASDTLAEQQQQSSFLLPVIGDYDQSHIKLPSCRLTVSGASRFLPENYETTPTADDLFHTGRRMHPMVDLWTLSLSILHHLAAHCQSQLIEALAVSFTRTEEVRNQRLQTGATTRADDMQSFLRLLVYVLNRFSGFSAVVCNTRSTLYTQMNNPEAFFKRFKPSKVDDNGLLHISAIMLTAMYLECLAVLHHYAGIAAVSRKATDFNVVVPSYRPDMFDFFVDTTYFLQSACIPAAYNYAGDKAPFQVFTSAAALNTGVLQIGPLGTTADDGNKKTLMTGRVIEAQLAKNKNSADLFLKLNNPALPSKTFKQYSEFYAALSSN
jgi:hypothetical protein